MSIFTTAWNAWASGLASQATQVSAADWQAAVDTLKQKAAEFSQVFSQLVEKRKFAADDAQRARVDKLIARGEAVRATVQSVTSAIDFGAQLLPTNLLSGNAARLGALPLIPIAAIVGAIAVITAWLSDAYVEVQRLDLAERVRKEGGNPIAVLHGGAFWRPWMWVPVGAAAGLITWRLIRDNKKTN